MSSLMNFMAGPSDPIKEAVAGLVRTSRWGDCTYVNLPMIMPSGSPTTVKITKVARGFRVDDGGFAYRELEGIGAERSFSRAALKFSEPQGLSVGKRTIWTEASENELARRICDVGAASFSTVNDVYLRHAEDGAEEIQDYLRERLETIFKGAKIESEIAIRGASAHEWTMSNALYLEDKMIVFHAVGNHAYSIYKASTAFHDLNELPRPPQCVAVVKDQNALGVNLNVLAQAGRVIQGDQSDEVYLRAAA